MTAPTATEAERSIIARMLRESQTIGEAASSMLTGDDFGDAAHRYLYDKLIESYYADDPVDAVSVATTSARYLAKVWGVAEDAARQRVLAFTSSAPIGLTADHVALVRRASDARRLLLVVQQATVDLQSSDLAPEAVAGRLAQQATQIATGSMTTADLISFGDTGRAFFAETERDRAAAAAGVDLGVKFGIGAIDGWTHGVQPTELLVAAGEPGVGKSGVWWRAALNFTDRQMKRPKDRQIGTLVLSLEMGQKPSSQRVATMLSGVKTARMREGTITDAEIKKITQDWARRADYPLWFNYAPSVRASGLRALVAEAVRRHNVGLVVIDHFRMFRMDNPPRNTVDHDEEKIAFLKEQIAKEMNLAVVCLAHTRKIDDERGRPRPSDLRGSDQIRAHADFVNFLYRPSLYASEHELDSGIVDPTRAEFIWAKNRHGNTADSAFFFDPEHMTAW